nr:PEP-CTERM sorting domain-containing protein [Candidatus Omnitrophota bacterium]
MEYVASDGNPGGFIRAGGNRIMGFINRTADFTGDYLSKGYNGVSLDMVVLMQQLPAYKPYLVFRYSPSYNGWKYVIDDFTVNTAGTWQHFDIPLDPSWTDAEAAANGWAPVDSYMLKPFGETMSHVESFSLLSDYPSNVGKVLGLDNVRLNGTTTVPEPMTTVLFALGLVGMGMNIRNRK